MASYYADMNPRVRPDDLELHPSKYLMEHDTGIKVISTFVDFYLRQLYRQSGSGRVEVQKTGFRFEHIPSWVLNVEPSNEKPKEYNPIPDLDKLLRDVMRSGNPNLPIPETVVRGFVNCGKGFWWDWRYQMPWTKSKLLSPYIEFPRHLVSVQNGMSYWTRLPENGQEQMYHFFYHLRQLMAYVAVNPLGKRTFTPHSEIARLLTQMPFRIAYMRSGDMVNIIKTEDALPMCDEEFVEARTLQIKVQAIQKYCTVVAQSQVANPDSAPNQPPVSRWEDVR